MNKKSKVTLQKQLGLPKKVYKAPSLVYHGLVTQLTTGGTGNAQEGSSGQKPRP